VAGSGLTPVGELFHRFEPGGGVTGVVLLAESHLAVHTWPELGAVTMDVYVCNFSGDNGAAPEAAARRAGGGLRAGEVDHGSGCCAAATGCAGLTCLKRPARQPATLGALPAPPSLHAPPRPRRHPRRTPGPGGHAALAVHAAAAGAPRGAPPPFDVLRAMLFYIDEFPERLHHTKESELLFPKLRAACARTRAGARQARPRPCRRREADPRARARCCWPSR
jgi:hypothetical protein